jgi:hypothetical protein
MANEHDEAQAMQMPAPDPALRKLDRYVGTWAMSGLTLGADEDDVVGTTTFEWLPGGFFLQQRLTMNFMGMPIESLEIIGYEPELQRFSSRVYSNLVGMALPYNWDVQGDDLRIWTDTAEFEGRFDADGNGFSGGWRPKPGFEDAPGNVPYDISGTKS